MTTSAAPLPPYGPAHGFDLDLDDVPPGSVVRVYAIHVVRPGSAVSNTTLGCRTVSRPTLWIRVGQTGAATCASVAATRADQPRSS